MWGSIYNLKIVNLNLRGKKYLFLLNKYIFELSFFEMFDIWLTKVSLLSIVRPSSLTWETIGIIDPLTSSCVMFVL